MNTKSISKYYMTALVAFATSALPFSTVSAQSDAEEDDEVFELSPFTVDASEDSGYRATNSISGTRLNTRIKDVPMPIEVITEQFIKDTGSTDLRESLAYSAGIVLTSQNDAGAGNSNSSVGGVHNPEGATSAKTETSYKVRGFLTDATLRDGYRRQFSSDSANIGRVEVIRGPAALLYGIGNFGGIVNYMPKLPPSKEEQNLILSVGNEGHYRATHSIGRPLGGPWDLKFNLTSVYEENTSYTELSNDDKWFIAPIFTMKPTEKTEVTFDFEMGRGNADAVGFQSIRSRAGIAADATDRLERSGFLDFGDDKETRTMRWSGPDTFVDSETSNTRVQVTHQFAENLNLLVGYNKSNVKFHVRDVFGSIQTNVGPESLRATVNVIPADALNGDGEFDAGPVTDAIFEGQWSETWEEVGREQLRVEMNYNVDVFQNSEIFGFKNSFLLGRSEEKSIKDVFSSSTIENEHFYWNPTDSSYMRFGVNGDGTAAPGMEDVNNTIDTSWNQGTYLVHQGKFWNDRITTVSGIRRDRNDLNGYTNDFRAGTEETVFSGATSKDTMQLGLSFQINDRLSAYVLQADGIMPNFDGNRDVYNNPMEAITAQSEEVGIKFDLLEGKISGTISAYRIKQTGTPIFYWWGPSPAKGNFDRSADIVYNVSDFNPTVEADWRNGAFTTAAPEWNTAVASGAAYQIDDTWYVNATNADGAAYLDRVFEASQTTNPGWPGWLYNQDDNTNNAAEDIASADGWNGYVSGDQESSGWEAQFNFAPTENMQFVLNYAQTKRQVVNAGVFAEYPYEDGNWDRWAVWYFPDGQWGLTGRSVEDQFTNPQDTSTWQSLGYGAGEAQDDTPLHAVSGWGNYKFTEGKMKGLSVGMGFQWEDKREYFSGITDGAGQLVLDQEGERVVLYTKDRLNVDAMARYDFKMGETPANLQFNVYNLLDDTDAYGFIWARPMRYRLQLGMEF